MAAARILLVNLLLSSVVVGAAALILQADALWPFVLPLAPLFSTGRSSGGAGS